MISDTSPALDAEAMDGERMATITVQNPATGFYVGEVPNLARQDVADMAARARAAQPGWAALGIEGRAAVMRTAQRWMADNDDRVVLTVVSETGKTFEDAQSTDWGYTISPLEFWAKQAAGYLADERVPSFGNPVLPGRKLVIRYAPHGVVGVIGPWNFPIVNAFGDCIPALMAGNAVILKPSEVTPLSSLLMAEMLAECGLPADVFQVATGDGGTGGALVAEVDCMMFTGSTRTGRTVAAAAAERLIPCHLELGGKDPMIVCADADIEKAANAAAYFSMNNAGQVCVSIERVYVEEPVYDEFVRRVVDNLADLRQGPPDGPGSVDLGAVIFPPQLDVIESHVGDAVAKGARVLIGGHQRRGPGRAGDRVPHVRLDDVQLRREDDRPEVDRAGPSGGPWRRSAIYPRHSGRARHRPAPRHGATRPENADLAGVVHRVVGGGVNRTTSAPPAPGNGDQLLGDAAAALRSW